MIGLWRIAALVGLSFVTATPLAAAETPVRVGKEVGIAVSDSPLEVGIQYGCFKKQGLDIITVAFGGGSPFVQGLTGGGIDIGLTAAPELSLIVKGAPFKAVALDSVAPDSLVIDVRPDSKLKTVADLKGKKVAVTSAHSLTAWLTTQLSMAEGCGPDGIEQIYLPPTGTAAALKIGEVDGIVSDLATGFDLEARGEARILVNFGKYVPDLATDVIVASDEIIAKTPEAVRAFLKAWFETIDFVYAHKDASVPLMAETTHKSVAVMSKAYDALVPAGFFARRTLRREGHGAASQSLCRHGLPRRAARHQKALYGRFPAVEMSRVRDALARSGVSPSMIETRSHRRSQEWPSTGAVRRDQRSGGRDPHRDRSSPPRDFYSREALRPAASCYGGGRSYRRVRSRAISGPRRRRRR